MAGQLARKTRRRGARPAGSTASCRRCKAQLERPRRSSPAFRQQSEAARGADLRRRSGRDRRARRPAGRGHGRAGRREATLGRLRRLVERGGDPSASLGELGSSADAGQSASALKAELLRREAELAGQYGERHPKHPGHPRREGDQLDARIRDERRALLRQFEGEVARARGERAALAAQLDELKGKAVRREATAGRTAELEREVELSRRPLRGLARPCQRRGAAPLATGRSPMRG